MTAPGPFSQLEKALAHADRLAAIARGEIPAPVSVKVELTSVCNHDCHFCAYRRIVQDPAIGDLLDTRRAVHLVDELVDGGVLGLMLTGGGEPLLHPGVEDVLERCRVRGLAHGLLTNGTRMGRLDDESLRGLAFVRFSISAGTAEAYRRVHGVSRDDWNEVWRQVARVADRQRFAGVTVGVSFVVTPRSLPGVAAAARRARDAGAHYIHYRPAFEGPHSELDRQLDRTEIAAALRQIDSVRDDPTFRIYGVGRRFEEIHAPDRRHVHCGATPLVAYVLPGGEVSICTMVRDRAFNPAVTDPFLGNLHHASFFDLWGTERHRSIISALSSSGCGRCHFAEYNRALSLVAADSLHRRFL